MKKLIFSLVLTFTSIAAFSQDNSACYQDTGLVEQLYIRQDTVWVVKQQYQKGNWNLYWDFALTKVKSEIHYNNYGGKSGTWKEYYKNGQIASEWMFDSALVSFYPPGKEWYTNGKLKTDRTQSADSVRETRYYPSGKVRSESRWDKTGKWVVQRIWCENGQLELDYNPTSEAVTAVKKYHCNGKVQSEYNWYAYGYVGKYKEYHPNGQLAVDGQYTEKPPGVNTFIARKTGTWTYYDDKGKVTKTEKWENGRLLK